MGVCYSFGPHLHMHTLIASTHFQRETQLVPCFAPQSEHSVEVVDALQLCCFCLYAYKTYTNICLDYERRCHRAKLLRKMQNDRYNNYFNVGGAHVLFLPAIYRYILAPTGYYHFARTLRHTYTHIQIHMQPLKTEPEFPILMHNTRKVIQIYEYILYECIKCDSAISYESVSVCASESGLYRYTYVYPESILQSTRLLLVASKARE